MSEAMIIIKEILPYSANGFSMFGILSNKKKNQ